MQTIGVIGGGTMGAGVAQAVAESGFKVVVIDISQEALKNCLGEIKKQRQPQRLLKPNHESGDQAHIFERIVFTEDYTLLHETTFVVENVPEDLGTKHAVYQMLAANCPKGCI